LLVVIGGALLFVIATFLPWMRLGATETDVAGTQYEWTEWRNGWSGDVPWLILGADLTSAENGVCDMLFGVVLVGGAAVLAIVVATGAAGSIKKVFVLAIIGLGAIAVLLVLLEALALPGEIGDWRRAYEDAAIINGGPADVRGGVSLGIWLALLGALTVVGGGVWCYLEQQRTAATRSVS
jgi:hypothetical protein